MSLFPPAAVSAFADIIIALLKDEPDAWTFDDFCLNHPCGFRVWVCSGFWFVKLRNPEEVKFGWKKIPLWLACRAVLKREKKRKASEQVIRLQRRMVSLKDNVVAFRGNAA